MNINFYFISLFKICCIFHFVFSSLVAESPTYSIFPFANAVKVAEKYGTVKIFHQLYPEENIQQSSVREKKTDKQDYIKIKPKDIFSYNIINLNDLNFFIKKSDEESCRQKFISNLIRQEETKDCYFLKVVE
jgi:hypothetical protein